jgi:hypothetical protein
MALLQAQKDSNLVQQGAMSGAEQAVVAHFDKAWRQDVLQEAPDELLGRQGAGSGFVGVGLLIAKGDLVIFKVKQAVVAEGDAKDVGGQIFQSGLTVAHRLAMDDPSLSPDLGRNLLKQIGLMQFRSEFGPKEAGQGLDVNQEIGASGLPELAIG